MSIRVDTASWIPGTIVCGNRGLGVLADDIPSEGDNGASYLYNDITLPADSGKEICGRITTWPSTGALYAYEDGSFEFSGAPDGQYSFDYTLYVDGAASGTGTVSLQVGDSTVDFSVTTDAAVFSGSAGSGAAVSIDAIADASVFNGSAGAGAAAFISALADSAVFSGAAKSGAEARITATAADAVFSGSALSLPQSSALITAATEGAAFSGNAAVSPVSTIVALTDSAAFSGSAVVATGATWPLTSDVRLGVTYGPTGTEYTGTMVEGSGSYPTAESIAAAVLAALQATPIPVNNTLINGAPVIGDGSETNPWRGAGVQP